MRFSEIVNRLTGVSCPIFGVSWNPVELEREVARRVIIFLEPRRVLYAPMGIEALCSSLKSVSKIKDYLTSEIHNTKDSSELSSYMRAMRKSCNKFISSFPDSKNDKCIYCKPGTDEYQVFIMSIGEMRVVFGIMIGQICKAFGIDVEDELAQIIPE